MLRMCPLTNLVSKYRRLLMLRLCHLTSLVLKVFNAEDVSSNQPCIKVSKVVNA